jgi:hypothetical protein
MLHRDPNVLNAVIPSGTGVESSRGHSVSSRVIPSYLGRKPILFLRVISDGASGLEAFI